MPPYYGVFLSGLSARATAVSSVVQFSLLMGAPGAALLYAILALATLPVADEDSMSVSRQPAFWLAFVWCAFWVAGGIGQLATAPNTAAGLSSMIAGSASGAPQWLATVDTHVASAIGKLGSPASPMSSSWGTMQMAQTSQGSNEWLVLILALLMIGIGIGVFRPGLLRKFSVLSGIVLSFIFWIVGQSLGSYYTGLATDPNSGPLFILLAVAILGCTNLDKELTRFAKKLENIVV